MSDLHGRKGLTTNSKLSERTVRVLALLAISLSTELARGQDPGAAIPVLSEASDQKSGSVLVYNLVTSSAVPGAGETRISLTNSDPAATVYVRLFFVDGTDGALITQHDVCLAPLRTASVSASSLSAGRTGFVIAEAIDGTSGVPANRNVLSGQAEIQLPNGNLSGATFGLGEWRGTLPAVAFAKVNDSNVISTDMTLAALFFDGVNLAGSYNRLARVVQLPDIPGGTGDSSPVLGSLLFGGPAAGFEGGTVCAWSSSAGAGGFCPSTILVVNRIGGNMTTAASGLGAMSGELFNDVGSSATFAQAGGTPQLIAGLGEDFPASVPDFPSMVPDGHTGWMKLWTTSDQGLSGVVLYARRSGNSGTTTRSNGGVNLRALTLSSAATLVVPVSPPSCGG